jgi:ankyrin repeat protein
MSSREQLIFNLIKSHQYDKLITLIKEDETLDLNILDETNTYLIQYVILFRQKDLLALLITRNCKLDILDSEGNSIFYIPIKFGYNDIVRLLINFSNVVIGIPLLELQDDRLNIPLHYAIIYNKYDIIDEILDSNFNINFKNINGDTSLHLIVKNLKSDKLYLLTKLLNKKIGLNHINNLGQNALHIAAENNNIEIAKILLENNINIDIQTIDDHLTPLIIATIHNNIEFCELLLKYNPNIDSQDIYGNSVLNHSILNKSKQMIKLYYDKINVDLLNISGQNSINLFFNNNYELDKLDQYYFREILKKSKLNIQNNQGKTTWHYLTSNDIWEKYADIFLDKKNKIFIQDLEGITPYEIIKTKFGNKMNKFIDLIANSFYNYILKNPTQEFSFIGISNNGKKEDIMKKIKKYIVDDHISCPEIKKSYCINEEKYENIKFSSYVGISLDIVCGLIYIKNKFDIVETSLTKKFIKNEVLENYYKTNGIQRGKFSDFLNFELIWSFHKLFIPTIFKDLIDKFKSNEKKKYLVIPIGIELTNGAHANILLYNKLENELERFEPYGKDYPPGFNYNPKSLDISLKNLFSNFFENDKNPLKYFSPFDYETKIGLQLLDSYEYSKEKNIGDPGGFCAAWSLWYIEMRINNNSILRNEIINKLITHIRMKQIPFRTVIRNFTKNIIDIRDKILLNGKIDINNWLNDNFSEEQWNIIINNIKSYV